MKAYHQYCPIARASEILAQRWTPLVVRELLKGPITYNHIANGLPGISRTLLTTRLRELQRLELVQLVEGSSASGQAYKLTTPGEDLAEVLHAIGAWGERWLEVAPEHADPGYLLNAWCKSYLATDRLPSRRVVARFEFSDQPGRPQPLWFIFDGEASEVCAKHPGFEEDLIVEAESVALAEWHLGRIEWATALDERRISVTGLPKLARGLPTWNRRSIWASAHS